MKFKDSIWIIIIILITSIFVIPYTRSYFEKWTNQFPYLMGFIKTAVLATMGEILVSRFRTKQYFFSKGFFLKFLVWGFLGLIFVLVFKIFASGVVASQEVGLLPKIETESFLSKLITAFLISFIMNLIFAPSFMILHRITDTAIALAEGKIKNVFKVKLVEIIKDIDWQKFFGYTILKTIPFFWIPAHTITFMLPENYRVLMAAYLSIVLGILLTLSSTKKHHKNL